MRVHWRKEMFKCFVLRGNPFVCKSAKGSVF